MGSRDRTAGTHSFCCALPPNTMATTVAASMLVAFLMIASPHVAAADGAPCDGSSGASCEASSDSASMLQAKVHVHAAQIGEKAAASEVHSEKDLLEAPTCSEWETDEKFYTC